MSLPWDELQPEPEEIPLPPEPEPEPEELPYVPPENLPKPFTPVEFDMVKVLKEAFSEALRETSLKDRAKEYTKSTLDAMRRGETVDVLHPTITAETSKGKELVVADAKSRSGRTLVQGLAIDLTVAIVAVLATLTGTADLFNKETWILFAALLVKTVIQTIVSYFMRLKVTPTIRTPGEKMAIMPVPRPMIDEERSA